MSLESRSRMISFRLTDEEYEKFRRLCISRGLRNVSELVRTAVNQMIDAVGESTANPAPEINSRVSRLESRLSDLATVVDRLESRLAGEHVAHREAINFVQPANS